MMRALSHLVSYLFHPLLMPIYAMLLVFGIYPYYFAHLDFKAKVLAFGAVFLNTFFFPVLAICIMKGLGMISNFKMETRNERILPFIATMVFYFYCYMVTNKMLQLGEFPSDIILGGCITVFLLFLINLSFKVSIHAAGVGNLVGVVLMLITMSSFNLEGLFLAVILLAGVVGTARLYLGAHQNLDIYSGYFVGLIGQLIAFKVGEFLPV